LNKEDIKCQPANALCVATMCKCKPYRTVLEKIDKLVTYLGRKSEFFGDEIEFRLEEDWPIAYCLNQDEFRSIVHAVKARGFTRRDFGDTSDVKVYVPLTDKGWEYFYELDRKKIESNQCFVAMSFGEGMTAVYEDGIKPAVEETGCQPVRVDFEDFNERIDDRIIAGIRKSRFLVADFTGHR